MSASGMADAARGIGRLALIGIAVMIAGPLIVGAVAALVVALGS